MSKLAALKKIAAQSNPKAEGSRRAKPVLRDRLGRFARQNAGGIKAGIVNLGELAGGRVGQAIAGDAGQLAGGLVGTLVTRKAIADAESTYSAHQKLKREHGYAKLTRLEKLKKLKEAAIEEAKAKTEQTRDEMLEDGAGWAIGNASGRAIAAAVPAIAAVPGLGAPPAMLLAPKVVTLKQRLVNHAKKRRRSQLRGT